LGAVTYPDATVANYINENFIPLQINVQANSEIAGKYRVFWTPTILILDTNGTEYYRFNGFLPPGEFIPQLKFGLGMMALEKQDYKTVEAYRGRRIGHHTRKAQPDPHQDPRACVVCLQRP